MKRHVLPILVGVIASIIGTCLGYGLSDWQFWLVSMAIITMSWLVVPLHKKINK